tara:strand:+ start:7728 stop:7904 length:177 start_codon:yes stop_codon:yes gene_type:complete
MGALLAIIAIVLLLMAMAGSGFDFGEALGEYFTGTFVPVLVVILIAWPFVLIFRKFKK